MRDRNGGIIIIKGTIQRRLMFRLTNIVSKKTRAKKLIIIFVTADNICTSYSRYK